MREARAAALLTGATAAAILFTWQFLTVAFNYGGNWSALFCTGSRLKQPPVLAGENIHRFADSYGYDGQFYHYIAHDPLLQEGLDAYVDAPRLRYRRILVPGLAWLAAGGRRRWVDEAYFTAILAFGFLGAYWLSRLAAGCGRSPAWGLAFTLIPSVVISVDRMTVDIALAALAVAFVLYQREPRPAALGLTLAAAALARETGLVLVAACCLAELRAKRFRRAAWFAATAVPAAGWYGYVNWNTRPYSADWLGAPFAGIVRRMLEPAGYRLPPLGAALVTGLDYLALAGVLAAFLLGLVLVWKRDFSRQGLATALLALAGILLARADAWQDMYGFPRTLTPLLMLPALRALQGGPLWYAAPLLMAAPRVLLQLGPQALGVARHLAPGAG